MLRSEFILLPFVKGVIIFYILTFFVTKYIAWENMLFLQKKGFFWQIFRKVRSLSRIKKTHKIIQSQVFRKINYRL